MIASPKSLVDMPSPIVDPIDISFVHSISDTDNELNISNVNDTGIVENTQVYLHDNKSKILDEMDKKLGPDNIDYDLVFDQINELKLVDMNYPEIEIDISDDHSIPTKYDYEIQGHQYPIVYNKESAEEYFSDDVLKSLDIERNFDELANSILNGYHGNEDLQFIVLELIAIIKMVHRMHLYENILLSSGDLDKINLFRETQNRLVSTFLKLQYLYKLSMSFKYALILKLAIDAQTEENSNIVEQIIVDLEEAYRKLDYDIYCSNTYMVNIIAGYNCEYYVKQRIKNAINFLKDREQIINISDSYIEEGQDFDITRTPTPVSPMLESRLTTNIAEQQFDTVIVPKNVYNLIKFIAVDNILTNENEYKIHIPQDIEFEEIYSTSIADSNEPIVANDPSDISTIIDIVVSFEPEPNDSDLIILLKLIEYFIPLAAHKLSLVVPSNNLSASEKSNIEKTILSNKQFLTTEYLDALEQLVSHTQVNIRITLKEILEHFDIINKNISNKYTLQKNLLYNVTEYKTAKGIVDSLSGLIRKYLSSPKNTVKSLGAYLGRLQFCMIRVLDWEQNINIFNSMIALRTAGNMNQYDAELPADIQPLDVQKRQKFTAKNYDVINPNTIRIQPTDESELSLLNLENVSPVYVNEPNSGMIQFTEDDIASLETITNIEALLMNFPTSLPENISFETILSNYNNSGDHVIDVANTFHIELLIANMDAEILRLNPIEQGLDNLKLWSEQLDIIGSVAHQLSKVRNVSNDTYIDTYIEDRKEYISQQYTIILNNILLGIRSYNELALHPIVKHFIDILSVIKQNNGLADYSLEFYTAEEYNNQVVKLQALIALANVFVTGDTKSKSNFIVGIGEHLEEIASGLLDFLTWEQDVQLQ
jgi:hypothetical protein